MFYSRLAKKYTPFTFANEYERELYEKSVKKLVRFREVDDLVKSLHDFTWNIKTIYEDTQRNITNNNLLSRKTEVTDVLTILPQIMEQDIKEIIHRYIQLVNNLEEYPEWQDKVKAEIGHYAHLIYNNLQEVDKEQLFEGFNKQEYFA